MDIHATTRPDSRARLMAGSSRAMSKVTMEMTTSNSISVKAHDKKHMELRPRNTKGLDGTSNLHIQMHLMTSDSTCHIAAMH